jgi:hypothetical protein
VKADSSNEGTDRLVVARVAEEYTAIMAKKKVAKKAAKKAAKKVAKKNAKARASAKARKPAARSKKMARKGGRQRAGIETRSPMRSSLGGDFEIERPLAPRGTGSGAAGQSGDTQGLNRDESEDSESVEELVEEGQSFEADVISGVEDAPEPDQGEVRTHEVPEDDVPGEYTDGE